MYRLFPIRFDDVFFDKGIFRCRASPLKKQSTGLFFDSPLAERFVLFRRLKS